MMGGAGSVFWMVVSAFAAMVLKYAEIVLAHRHRRSSKFGSCGGAMYYIEDFLGGKIGKTVGGIFAVFCIMNAFSMGCMLQSNAVAVSFSQLGILPPVVIGFILALLCGAVILKDIHDISPLTKIVIPAMTLIYIVISAIVICRFGSELGNIIKLIFNDAFSMKSASGGILGYILSGQIRYGCMRGLLSNEAGCGTAPIAHASTKAKIAAEQGVWGIIEVFVDTVLLCTLTAFSILLVFGEGAHNFSAGDEMKLVISAYGAVLGRLSAPLLSVMVFFFAFATIICWAYYGVMTIKYFTKGKQLEACFKIAYILCIFAGTFHLGEFVWQISDIALSGMTIINLIILFLMRKEIKSETKSRF